VYENMLGLGLKLAWKVVIDEMLSAFHLFNISATTNIYSSIPVLTPSNLWIYRVLQNAWSTLKALNRLIFGSFIVVFVCSFDCQIWAIYHFEPLSPWK